MDDGLGPYADDLDAVVDAWAAADRDAAAVLREALGAHRDAPAPRDALVPAAAGARVGLVAGVWPLGWAGQAAGFGDQPPDDDAQLLVDLVAASISPWADTGLDPAEEAALISMEHADWLAAVVELVRRGPGTPADAEAVIEMIDDCPEVEGALDEEGRQAVGDALEVVLPVWEGVGVLDTDRRLTGLGAWVLPRALALAWDGQFDGS